MSILDLTAVELGRKIRAGEVTAVEAARAAIDQIKRLEPILNCYAVSYTHLDVYKRQAGMGPDGIFSAGEGFGIQWTVECPDAYVSV